MTKCLWALLGFTIGGYLGSLIGDVPFDHKVGWHIVLLTSGWWLCYFTIVHKK